MPSSSVLHFLSKHFYSVVLLFALVWSSAPSFADGQAKHNAEHELADDTPDSVSSGTGSIVGSSRTALRTGQSTSDESIHDISDDIAKVANLKIDRQKWRVDPSEEGLLLAGLTDEEYQHLRRAELLRDLGVALWRAKNFGAAEDAFKKSLAIQPKLSSSWSGLARVHIDQRKLALAQNEISKALVYNPSNDKAMTNKVRLEKALGLNKQYLKTHAEYKTMSEKNRNEHTQVNRTDRFLVVAALLQGRSQKNGFECATLGLALKRLGKQSDAARVFDAGMSQKVGKAASIYCMAKLESQRGKHERALKLAQDALAAEPRFQLAKLLSARERMQLNEWNKSIEILSQLIAAEHSTKSMRGEALSYRARCFAEIKQTDKSFADLDAVRLLNIEPSEKANILVRCASVRKILHDEKGALLDHDEAIRLSPKRYSALQERGELMLSQGDFEQGMADLAEASKRSTRVSIQSRLKAPSDAELKKQVDHYTKLLALNPKSETLYYERGFLRLALRQYALANADFAHVESHSGEVSDTTVSAVILATLALRLDGKMQQADQYIADYAKRHYTSAKPPVDLLFLLKEIPADQYVKTCSRGRSPAYMIVALHRLSEKKKWSYDSAKRYFTWAALECEPGTNPQVVSAVLLNRLFDADAHNRK